MIDDYNLLWERCVSFHTHSCGGLFTGFLASVYASNLLDLDGKVDEEVVCISENDSCAVDGVQVVLGCTIGKGNLLFHMTGKLAFSFFDRSSGRSLRLMKTSSVPDPNSIDVDDYCRRGFFKEVFSVSKTSLSVPERARIFDSYVCDGCRELTASNWIHIGNGRKLCPDCYVEYNRFDI